MKKRIIPFLMSIFMVISLAGCGKTTTSVTFNNVETIEVLDGSSIKNGSVGAQDNVLEFTTSKDGDYPLTVLLDGEECKVTISIEDGNANITTDPVMEYISITK